MSMPTLSACAAQAIHFLPDGDRLGCLSSSADGPGSLTASHIIFTARPFLDLRSAHYILILERIQDAAGRISNWGGVADLTCLCCWWWVVAGFFGQMVASHLG